MTDNREKPEQAEVGEVLKDFAVDTAKGFASGLMKTLSFIGGGAIVGGNAGGVLSMVYGWPIDLILWGAIAGAALAVLALAFWHAAGSLW